MFIKVSLVEMHKDCLIYHSGEQVYYVLWPFSFIVLAYIFDTKLWFIPGSLTQAIRNFAKSLENWLKGAMQGVTEEMVKTKVSSSFFSGCTKMI